MLAILALLALQPQVGIATPDKFIPDTGGLIDLATNPVPGLEPGVLVVDVEFDWAQPTLPDAAGVSHAWRWTHPTDALQTQWTMALDGQRLIFDWATDPDRVIAHVPVSVSQRYVPSGHSLTAPQTTLAMPVGNTDLIIAIGDATSLAVDALGDLNGTSIEATASLVGEYPEYFIHIDRAGLSVGVPATVEVWRTIDISQSETLTLSAISTSNAIVLGTQGSATAAPISWAAGEARAVVQIEALVLTRYELELTDSNGTVFANTGAHFSEGLEPMPHARHSTLDPDAGGLVGVDPGTVEPDPGTSYSAGPLYKLCKHPTAIGAAPGQTATASCTSNCYGPGEVVPLVCPDAGTGKLL